MAIYIDHAELGQDVFMNQDPLRLGVVGVGDVAQRDYLPEIDRLKPEAVVVAARASVSRSPVRFRKSYVISIKDLVGFVTDRPHSLSSTTVLQAKTTLMQVVP